LTRRIRIAGAMRGIISTETKDRAILLARVRAYPGLVGRDLVGTVTCREPYSWRDGAVHPMPPIHEGRKIPERLRIAVLDCGVKYNILRNLEKRGCETLVLPATATAVEIQALCPDGLLLSNGPGDPAALSHIVDTVRQLLGKLPVFGICLGHQILGQALGGKTAKLKFGHHGINQPVKNRNTGRVEITSQNHGFVVVPESLSQDQEKTYDNLNDNTSEGLRTQALRAFSVQYHPEAAPGPHDATYLFDEFIKIIRQEKGAVR
jgi:carbamoyl-phosphate synthase small subunit